MGTRSCIAVINRDTKKVRAIYCHWDGYPSHNGAILVEHYKGAKKVNELIDLGSISSLAKKVSPKPGESHSYEDPAKGVTVAYHRDRGEDLEKAKEYQSFEEFKKNAPRFFPWCEYAYLFDEATNQWAGYAFTGRGLRELNLDEEIKKN